MYDILIKNGEILNGTGSPSIRAQIAIQDGKIVKIARKITGEAKTVIDATGLTVTPGFIDSHSHSDNSLITFPDLAEKLEHTQSLRAYCIHRTQKRSFLV